MTRIFILIFIAVIVSGLSLSIGYLFDIKWLMFYYYEDTAFYWETSLSFYPFVLAAICCYLVDKCYFKKQSSLPPKE